MADASPLKQLKPLRLRAEKTTAKRSIVDELPYVDVLVNVPFVNAQEIYTYSLTEDSAQCQVGDLVSVPFGSQSVEGVVLSRYGQLSNARKIKSIQARISIEPVFTSAQIALAQVLAGRYSTDTWSFFSAAAPEYSKSGAALAIKNARESSTSYSTERETVIDLPNALRRRLDSRDQMRDLVILPTLTDCYEILIEMARRRSLLGKVVVVLPDTKDLERCAEILSLHSVDFISITSLQKKSERFANYALANVLPRGIVLTLRSGVFLALNENDTLIIFNEAESHHYERRSPSWNSRDIALARSPGQSVIFVSHSPSVEIVRQVESRWITKYIYPREKLKSAKFLSNTGVEPSLFPMIEYGLKRGNVLISVGRAGYINGFTCNKCRSEALCSCGGRLSLPSKNSEAICNLCGSSHLSWRCTHCGSGEVRIIARGAERSAAEFGRAFPKVKVIHSSGSDQVPRLTGERTLVVATLGSEPIGRYSAILILDAQSAYSQVSLRAQEEVRLQWFTLFSLLEGDGRLYLALPGDSAVAQGIIRSDPYDLALREMNERFTTELPPYFRLLLVEGAYAELDALRLLLEGRGFSSFLLDPRLRQATRVKSGSELNSRLLVKFPVDRGDECAEIISATQRIRGSRKKTAFSIKYDPYSID